MGDVGPDELNRRLDAHERRTDAIHASLDDRITQVARDAVPLLVWQQAERARDAEMQRLDRERREDLDELRRRELGPVIEDVKALKGRPAMTFGRWVAALGVVAAFLAVLVTAWAASKGAK